MGPALSGLSPRSAFSFILCRIGACSGIGRQLAKNQCCMTSVELLFRFWLAKLYHLRQMCVCLRVRLHAYSQDLRQSCKTRMIHTYSRRRFGTATPRKTANRQFSIFFGPNCPANRAQKPAISTQKPANGRKSGFLP